MIVLRKLLFKIILPLLTLMLAPQNLFSLQVGSNTAPTRQASPDFVPTQNDNAMIGFASFENGFDLWDCATRCSFDALYPVSGTVDLHGGTLFLMEDLIFSDTTLFNTMGNLYGNQKTIRLASSITTLQSTATDVIPTFTSYLASATINSCDWSSSGSFVVLATNNQAGGTEVRVLGYDGINLTVKATLEIGRNAICVRWQPGTTNFALGLAAGTGDLRTYSFNIITNTITAVSSLDLTGNEQINGLSFSPGGGYLAVGRNSAAGGNQEEVWVYSISAGGTLTFVDSINFPSTDQNVGFNAVSWSPGSNYFAVGAADGGALSDLYIYFFNGTTITQTISIDTGENVRHVDWSPTGTFIAVTLTAGSTQRIRLYRHLIYNGTLTDQTTAYVGQTTDANSVAWKSDGTRLLAGMALSGGAAPIRLYDFNSTTTVLSLNSSLTFDAAVGDIRWNPNSTQFGVAAGTRFYVGGAYSNGFCFTVDQLNLELQNNLTLNAPLAIFNTCTVDGNSNIIDFQTTGSMVVQPNSTLLLKNVTLKNISGGQLRCLDNTATLSLDNVTFIFNGDYFFDTGAFHVLSNLSLSGTTSFVYRSTQQSTIRRNASLTCDYGITLSYAPTSNQRTGIAFSDNTGFLFLNGNTLYSTTTGLRLTKGNIVFDGKTTFRNDATSIPQGIAFGDGVSAANDVKIIMMPGAQISVAQGFVVNENLS